MKLLTSQKSKAILNSLSKNLKAIGISSPISNGVKTPIQGVFYCLKKTHTPLVRAFVMVARSGQPKGWPAPLPGTANLLRVAAQLLADVGGGSYIQAMEPSK